MSTGKAVCLVCGEPLMYSQEAQEVTCSLCGKREFGHSVCAGGHYVCDTCHRAQGVAHINEVCALSDSTDPVSLMIEIMSDRSIYPNGPEHHTLVGAALITAYANAGGDVDKAAALAELSKRSLNVPGGTCGFWGCCGAAVSAGQALSILNGSTPMTREPWAQCQRLTSDILGRLADMGGPRCCKRTGFTAAVTAVEHIERITGVRLDLPERIVCTFFACNAECLRAACPYFPKRAEIVVGL